MSRRYRSTSRSPDHSRRSSNRCSPPQRSRRLSRSRSRSPSRRTHSPPGRKRNVLCRNYIRGECLRGNDCWFLHEEEEIHPKKDWDKRRSDAQDPNKTKRRYDEDDSPSLARKQVIGKTRGRDADEEESGFVRHSSEEAAKDQPVQELISSRENAGEIVLPQLPLPNHLQTGLNLSPEEELDALKLHPIAKTGGESRSMKLLRKAVTDFVKEALKPAWKEGHLSKEAFKTIAQKAVEKVMGTLQGHDVPKGEAKINQFMDSSSSKILKLVKGYLDKYAIS